MSVTSSELTIPTMSGEAVSPTDYGDHKITYRLSRGWGELIEGWGLEISPLDNTEGVDLDFGIDESSQLFRNIKDDAFRSDIVKKSAGYLNRTMHYNGRNYGTRPLATESVVASLLLNHVFKPEDAVLEIPELIVPITVIARNHSHSLRANKFIEIRNRYFKM